MSELNDDLLAHLAGREVPLPHPQPGIVKLHDKVVAPHSKRRWVRVAQGFATSAVLFAAGAYLGHILVRAAMAC
jgi:hypothetical protein